MGCGKTNTGRLLAKKLKTAFYDLDDLIEMRAGISVKEIFEISGEERFRQMEISLLDEFIIKDGVLALGGGSLLDHNSRRKILAAGVLVYLKTSKETLVERLKEADGPSTRPLLEGERSLEQVVEQILDEREKIYEEAHFIVETDNCSPEAVAENVIEITGVSKVGS